MSTMLTNDELAMLIKEGRNEHIAELWDNTRKLLYKYAIKYYDVFKARCTACGLTIEDLKQECFIIMCNMIEAYNPDKPYKFNTYAEWQFKKHFFRILLRRANGVELAPLNIASSLDKDIKGFEGDDLTLGDTISDETAEQAFEDVTEQIYHTQLHNTLELAMDKALTPEQRYVIHGRFWLNKPGTHISREMGQNNDYARKLESEALKALRRYDAIEKRLQSFRNEIITSYAYKGTGVSSFKYNLGSSVEITLERAEKLTKRDNTEP